MVPWTKVTNLATLPEDGTPTKFEVVLEKVKDAWNTYTNIPAGAVYIARKAEEVTAYNLKFPHLGCAIDCRKITMIISAPATTVPSGWTVR